MKKIIQVLHPITRLIVGGAQENTMYTAAFINKEQFDIDVLSGPQIGSEGSLIEELRSYGIPLIITPYLVRQINPYFDLRAYNELKKVMHSKNYNIVHTHSSKAGILGRCAARQAKVPIIIHTVHGWGFHDYLPITKRFLFILLERLCANFTDILIVVSHSDIAKGIKAGIGNFNQYRLIRSAIPLEKFNPDNYSKSRSRIELDIPQNAIVIGNVGRFSQQKNPFDWVKIAGEISRSVPDSFFLLVGDGPFYKDVENRLEEEGIRIRTLLTGLRRDIPNLMAAMDIFMITSLWEGLPRAIPQAMAMRKPLLAYRTNGIIEAIEISKAGFLCEPGDHLQMVANCIRLVNSPESRKKFGNNGRKYAINVFDLNHMINKISDLYLELL